MAYTINPFTGLFESKSEASIIASDSALNIKITRTASEEIFTDDVLKAFSSTHCAVSNANTTSDNATVLGIAQNDAAIGESVEIILFGVITSTAFSVFGLNNPLFLNTDGTITNVKRATGYHVVIGDSLGGNDIMFRPEKPITIA